MPSSEWPDDLTAREAAHLRAAEDRDLTARENEAAAAKASPVIPAPTNRTREWTLRVCPVCDRSKVNDDGFTVCEGPSCGPFPTDASHKPTVTDAVVVAEVEPLIWAREVAKSSANGWRAAFDYLALHLDDEDAETAAVLEAAEARRVAAVPEVIPGPKCETCSDDSHGEWKRCPECKGHGQPDGDGSGWDGTSTHTPACALCGGRGEVPAHFPCGNARDSCHGDTEIEECACWRRWREASDTFTAVADCHGTGVAEVIPVAVLREWIERRRGKDGPARTAVGGIVVPDYGWALDDLAALLDEVTP